MCKTKSDPNFLTDATDGIYSAVWAAVCEMAHNADDLEWDMAIICEVCDRIVNALKGYGIPACYPFQMDDETICYASGDRCTHCTR